MAHEHEGNMANEFDAAREQISTDMGAAVAVVEKIEAISIKLPSKNDQDVRDIVRLISEKGADYSSTEYGDMTLNLLCSLERIMNVIDAYRCALESALPHIESKTKEQDQLITHIGEIIFPG